MGSMGFVKDSFVQGLLNISSHSKIRFKKKSVEKVLLSL